MDIVESGPCLFGVGKTSTVAADPAPSEVHFASLSYIVAAETYPPGRPILLYQSLSSVMVMILLMDGTPRMGESVPVSIRTDGARTTSTLARVFGSWKVRAR